MTTDLRVLRPAEWGAWYTKLEDAFGGITEAPEKRQLWHDLTETERSLAVWDGAECVGTATAFSFQLAVPGGAAVPTAGVSFVSVQPTHRRRGVLRSMMRRQLDDVRAAGEPLAALTASEPDIYGRFGYGFATQSLYASIDLTQVRLSVPDGTDALSLRLAAPESVLDICEAIYAERAIQRPGGLARRPGWERLALLDPPADRAGTSPLKCVLVQENGQPVGYARYAIKLEWQLTGAQGSVHLRDIEALHPRAYAALWRFLSEIDLTSTLVLRNRPVDDPLLHLVSDIRRCSVRITDRMYVRLVEVGAALAARTYAAPVELVFEVTDPFCPWNEGRWRLSGDRAGATCARTTDAADLALSVRELSSAYLGGVSLAVLGQAGRVQELRKGALSEAAVAFGHELAPWLPHNF
ncbi:GNAT family N-acetyltransferase [Streptomyces zagrosensis]|uniref:Putative acetyltransferase n=1 Tax=Streptomyces zagrosensis TaxID=1042984 RepID=A0A7W9Q7A1_9ACTN|nr:GNAT family N-acetyltransferase [Streptomyces zagrosensis]MBB5934910.1 putative acetyltransferase [Streptomyces zagrosensis]